VILDYVLPGADGLVTLRRILESRPSAAVLMLSMRDDERLVQEALAAGAKGFVVKDAIDIRLDVAVRRVAGGEIVLSAGVASFRDRPSAEVRLTSRQLQVLRLICRGRSARAIGAELGLSEHTVRVHRAGIMRALRIHRTTALVSYAIRYGLVDPSEPGAGGGAQSSSS
jgi:DNA-binding NarL/FixJ family response regulator